MVLEACPRLSSLDLSYATDGGYRWCTGQGPDLKGLERLSISYPEYFPLNPAELELPNLRHLELFIDGTGEEDFMRGSALKAILLPLHQSLVTLRLVNLESATVAARLVEILSEEPFRHVRDLTLMDLSAIHILPDILLSFPSLSTLELYDSDAFAFDAVGFVGTNPLPTLQNLVLSGAPATEFTFSELTRIIKLPNLDCLRRVEIPSVSKDELANETGLALLEECEERSISLLCSYGYLTRGMMEEGAPRRS
ncbi:hypothetical protein RQP46_010275 [Phenoliferia psychrophenolica]